MENYPSTEAVFNIFKQLNQIPRPSHHEERVADYLCQFAEESSDWSTGVTNKTAW